MANKIHYNTVATPSTRPSVVYDPAQSIEIEADTNTTVVNVTFTTSDGSQTYEFIGNRPPRLL